MVIAGVVVEVVAAEGDNAGKVDTIGDVADVADVGDVANSFFLLFAKCILVLSIMESRRVFVVIVNATSENDHSSFSSPCPSLCFSPAPSTKRCKYFIWWCKLFLLSELPRPAMGEKEKRSSVAGRCHPGPNPQSKQNNVS